MQLPSIQSNNREFQMLQSKWSSILNPVIAQPLSSSNILSNVNLAIGVNVINHLLGKQMQGWIISDINAAASIFRSAALNDKTITLTSNAACVINLVVF